MEDLFFIPEIFFKIIRMIAISIFIITFSVLIYSSFQTNQINLVDKSAIETANTILRNPGITSSDGIIDVSKLNSDNLNIGCRYQYNISIKSENFERSYFNSRVNFEDLRSVYHSNFIIYGRGSSSFPVALNLGDEIVPGNIKINLYDTNLSRILCAIEDTEAGKKDSYVTLSPFPNFGNRMKFEIKQNGNELCIFVLGTSDCIRTNSKVNRFYINEPIDNNRQRYPTKIKVFSTSSTGHSLKCEDVGDVMEGDRISLCLLNSLEVDKA